MWWMTAATEVQSLFCERAKVLLTQPDHRHQAQESPPERGVEVNPTPREARPSWGPAGQYIVLLPAGGSSQPSGLTGSHVKAPELRREPARVQM